MPVPAPVEVEDGPQSFVSGLVVTVFVALALCSAYWLFMQAGRSAALVAHTLTVKRQANELLTLTLDAESASRGYLITGDRTFLQPYTEAVTQIGEKLHVLKEMTNDNPRQMQILSAIEPLIEERLAGLKRSVDRTDSGNRDAAITAMRTGRGREIQENIRASLRDMLDEEQRLLAERESRVEWMRLLSVLPMALAIIGLTWLGWQEAQRRNRRTAALKQYNATLDQLVRERTSELQKERARVEALLRDVTHRVGNNLAMIVSMLNIQRRRISDPHARSALEEVSSRIQAMATGQRRLNLDIEMDAVDGKAYLEDLISEVRTSMLPKNVVIETDISELRLPGKDAVSYIILLNELLTNAIKHAFPDGSSGHIRVRVQQDKSQQVGAVVMVVEDDGVGGKGDEGKGLGKAVLRSLLQSLDGTIVYEPARQDKARPGMRVTLRLKNESNRPDESDTASTPVAAAA